eukprot:g295.t1
MDEHLIRERMTKNAKFSPPTYFSSYRSREVMLILLKTVGEVFTNFEYHRQWLSEDGQHWCLEFSAEIADSGKKIKGCDLVTLNSDGKITDFEVVARPPSAVSVLKKEMGERALPKLMALKKKSSKL